MRVEKGRKLSGLSSEKQLGTVLKLSEPLCALFSTVVVFVLCHSVHLDSI